MKKLEKLSVLKHYKLENKALVGVKGGAEPGKTKSIECLTYETTKDKDAQNDMDKEPSEEKML